MRNQPQRLERLFTHHPIYFVTTCTENRKRILANAKIHESFVNYCQNGLTREVFVGRYVLMPDHIHLFVRFGKEYEQTLIERRQARLKEATSVAAVCDRHIPSLSFWMKSLKNSLSKTFNAMNQEAPHWQKGFFDHVLRGSESYSQ